MMVPVSNIGNVSCGLAQLGDLIGRLSQACAVFDRNPKDLASVESKVVDLAHCNPEDFRKQAEAGFQIRRIEGMIDRLNLACKIIDVQADTDWAHPERASLHRAYEGDIGLAEILAYSITQEFDVASRLYQATDWNEPSIEVISTQKDTVLDAIDRIGRNGPDMGNAGLAEGADPLQALFQYRVDYAVCCYQSIGHVLDHADVLVQVSAALIRTGSDEKSAAKYISRAKEALEDAENRIDFTRKFVETIYDMCPDAMDTVNVKATQNVPAPLNFDFI